MIQDAEEIITESQSVKLMTLLILMGLDEEEVTDIWALLQKKKDALAFCRILSEQNYKMNYQQMLRAALEINLGHPI